MSEIIIGRNAVLEALKNNREIEKITLAKGAEGSVKQIAVKAKKKRIPCTTVKRSGWIKRLPAERIKGVIAVVSDYRYCEVGRHVESGGKTRRRIVYRRARRPGRSHNLARS